MKTFKYFLLALAIVLAGVPAAQAQVLDSGPASTSLSLTVPESLTISAAPGAVTFSTPDNGISYRAPTITVTTSWTLAGNRTDLTAWAYFVETMPALSAPGGSSIPISAVNASVDGGALQVFTQLSPFSTASVGLFHLSTPPALGSSGRTNTVDLLVMPPAPLAAGNYTGTLYFQAEAL